MSLPTDNDIKRMQYVFNAKDFVEVSAKSTIDLTKMQYVFDGKPFVSNPFGGANTNRFFHFF